MIETLPISGSVSIVGDSELCANRLERALGRAEVIARDRERDLGVATLLARLVLDDRVDVAVRVGERAEDRRGRAGAVGNAHQRDPRLVGRVGHGGDQGVLHRLVFSDHEGTGTSSKLERQWIRTPWVRAYSTERSCRTLAPDAAISSISSKLT